MVFCFFRVICILAAIKQREHILITILGVESRILILASIYVVSYSPLRRDYLIIGVLSVSVAHAAIRLALLASLTRSEGSDSMLLCKFS